MNDLSEFQKQCQKTLSSALASAGFGLQPMKVSGLKEKYLEVEIRDLKIWIYNDGAEIGGNKADFRFEAIDYNGADDLIGHFVERVLGILMMKPGEQ